MRLREFAQAGLLAGPLLALTLHPGHAQAPSALVFSQPVTADGVRRVQDRLKAAGAFSGDVDGSWGPESAAALQRYQQGNGLQPTGQLNPATLAVLGIVVGDVISGAAAAAAPLMPAPAQPPPPPPAAQIAQPQPAPPPPAPPQPAQPQPAPADTPPPASPPPAPTASEAPHAPFALSGDSIRIVQSRLRQLGFYNGDVDGVWGGGTQAAMHAFENARGLPVTPGLNAQTVTALGIDPASMVPR